MERLPVELHHLFPELDGTFPNHPADPIDPENQRDLRAAVLRHEADIGLAFDGDADRVFLIDERGSGRERVDRDGARRQGHARARTGRQHHLQRHLLVDRARGDPSRTAACPVRTRVGHSFIKQVMAETGAIFGGEHSGHYYFRENYRADSGLIAAVVVMAQLSRGERSALRAARAVPPVCGLGRDQHRR